MTDRIKGLTIALAKDIRIDDAEQLIEAIKMLRGVTAVRPQVSDSDDWVNREQIKNELKEKLWKVLE